MPNFACDECGKEYKSQYALTSHQNFHRPEHVEKMTNRVTSPAKIERLRLEREQKKLHLAAEYDKNPSSCPECGEAKAYHIRNNKFCSRSCGGKHSNKNRTEDSRRQQSISLKETHHERNPKSPRYCSCGIKILCSRRKTCSDRCAKKRKKRIREVDRMHINHSFSQSTSKLNEIGKCILNLTRDITIDDVGEISTKIQDHLDDGLSPTDIKQLYNIKYSDFGMFIKHHLGIKLLNVRDAVINFNIKTNRQSTNQKAAYKSACAFRFNPYEFLSIPGYDRLLKYGIYHPVKNPDGMCRDHMISKEFGWIHSIDPALISHPANCQFLSNTENVRKGIQCHLSVDELNARIRSENYSK